MDMVHTYKSTHSTAHTPHRLWSLGPPFTLPTHLASTPWDTDVSQKDVSQARLERDFYPTPVTKPHGAAVDIDVPKKLRFPTLLDKLLKSAGPSHIPDFA